MGRPAIEDLGEEKWVKPLSVEEKARGILATIADDPKEMSRIYDDILCHLAPMSLGAFGEFCFGWKPAPHHQEWIDILENENNRHIAIVAPPGHGKSNWIMAYTLWALSRQRGRHFAYVSCTSQQANKPSVAMRDTIKYNGAFKRCFPSIQPDYGKGWGEKEWFVERPDVGDKDASLFAVGVDGPILGARVDEVILDDICDQRNMATKLQRCKVRDWVDQTLDSRLPKDGSGRLVSIMCMTGDTRVLMADGLEKDLSAVRTGDMVASYDNGRLRPARVLNWANQGLDDIFTIKTKSGIALKANARHPFLVEHKGERVWVRVQDLTVGDRIVRVSGGHGQGCNVAPKAVSNQYHARGSVDPTIVRSGGPTVLDLILPRQEQLAYATDMGSVPMSTISSSRHREESVPFVESLLVRLHDLIGRAICALTTVTNRARSGDYSATTVISPLGMERLQRYSSLPLSIYEITLDSIESITPSGREEVFDLQVEGTENFIANGIVSHNTRWHVEDIMLLLEQYPDFICINMPALGYWETKAGNEPEDDTHGSPLWPQFHPAKGLLEKRTRSREVFERMYMGRPGIKGGKIFQDHWWRYYNDDPATFIANNPPDVIIQSWDTALKDKDINDWTVCETWAVYKHGAYLIDFWKGKPPFLKLVEQIVNQRIKWKSNTILVEDKASGTSAIQTLRATLGIDIPVVPVNPKGSKGSRAAGCTGIIEAGMVYLPNTAPWVYDFVAVHAAYTGSDEDQDDEIDATSQALWYIQNRPFLNDDLITFDSNRIFGIDLIPDIDDHQDDPLGMVIPL